MTAVKLLLSVMVVVEVVIDVLLLVVLVTFGSRVVVEDAVDGAVKKDERDEAGVHAGGHPCECDCG